MKLSRPALSSSSSNRTEHLHLQLYLRIWSQVSVYVSRTSPVYTFLHSLESSHISLYTSSSDVTLYQKLKPSSHILTYPRSDPIVSTQNLLRYYPSITPPTPLSPNSNNVNQRVLHLHARHPLGTRDQNDRHGPHRTDSQRPRLARRDTLRALPLRRRHSAFHRHNPRLLQRQSRLISLLHILRASRYGYIIQNRH
jgi:hypothetical protein